MPYYAFLDAGLEVDIASPQGGRVPVEPNSMGWPLATDADRRFKRDSTAMRQLAQSLRVGDLDPATYDVVFLVGGWGAAYDLGVGDKDVVHTKASRRLRGVTLPMPL